MKLPNGERAVVDLEKLIDYCLNPEHPRGKHKARVFLSACGLHSDHAEEFREQLMEAAVLGEASPLADFGHGDRYMIEWSITGPSGTAMARTAWIVRPHEDFPRFVTAYIM